MLMHDVTLTVKLIVYHVKYCICCSGLYSTSTCYLPACRYTVTFTRCNVMLATFSLVTSFAPGK